MDGTMREDTMAMLVLCLKRFSMKDLVPMLVEAEGRVNSELADLLAYVRDMPEIH